MRHVGNLVTDEDIEDAETERNLKDSSMGDWDDFITDDSSSDDFFGNVSSSESLGGSAEDMYSGGENVWNQNYGATTPMQAPEKSTEDKIFDALKEGLKGFGAFLKEFIEATKQTDTLQIVRWGTSTIITSIIIAIVGVLLAIFGIAVGWSLCIGSLISLATGLVIFGISFEKQKNLERRGLASGQSDDDELVTDTEEDIFAGEEDIFEGEDEDDDEDEETATDTLLGGAFADDTDEVGYSNSDDDIFGDLMSDSDDDDDIQGSTKSSGGRGDYKATNFYEDDDNDTSMVDEETMSKRIDSINISGDVVTRQYLLECYSQILPEITPKYSNSVDYDEDDRDFKEYAGLVRKAALSVNGKKKEIEDMPKLEKLQEKALYIKMTVSRSHSINIDKFVTELTQLLSYNEETDEVDAMLYITYKVVGDRWILKVFSGDTAKVSIMDTYRDKEVKSFIADNKNLMPVVLGINEEGKAIYLDVEKVNSLLVTGMPRSGKSWFALALLTQMTMYMKPSQLEIYMIDPKGETSDFKDFLPPHVKCFVSEHSDIITLLTRLIDVEAARRTKLFGTQNVKNIQEWNKKNPLEPCPYIYVYIDEVVTLAEAMDKETKQVFQSKLMEITTRLPNLGIRPILVPHVVKDQILKKSITDNIPCRISVKGDAKHIEACVGVDDPPFTYRLTHVGDMAVMLLDRHIHFVHSVIITEDTSNNIAIFEYIRKLWEKLEPDSIPSSCHYKAEHGIPLTTIGEVKAKESKISKNTSVEKKSRNISRKMENKTTNTNEGVSLSDLFDGDSKETDKLKTKKVNKQQNDTSDEEDLDDIFADDTEMSDEDDIFADDTEMSDEDDIFENETNNKDETENEDEDETESDELFNDDLEDDETEDDDDLFSNLFGSEDD